MKVDILIHLFEFLMKETLSLTQLLVLKMSKARCIMFCFCCLCILKVDYETEAFLICLLFAVGN